MTNRLTANLPSSAALVARVVSVSIAATIAARALVSGVAWLMSLSVQHNGVGATSAALVYTPMGAATAALLMWWTVGRAAAGTGTDVYIAAVHDRGPRPGWQLALTKLAVTVITVGSGGSGGLIGPALLIGSGLARRSSGTAAAVAAAEALRPDSVGLVMAAGAAAAVTAVWGAPWAAAMLVCEVVYRQGVAWRLMPAAVTGAVSSWLTCRLVWPALHSTRAADPPMIAARLASPVQELIELLPIAALVAALAAVMGVSLILGIRGLGRLVELVGARLTQSRGRGAVPGRALAAVALGGVLTALLGRYLATGILGFTGLPELATWIGGHGQGWGELGLAAGKVAGTVATVGSGGSGGVIGPALHVGAAVGRGIAALSGGCGVLLGSAGMAACLTAVSNVPVAATILMVEVLGMAALPFAILGSAIGFGLARGWVAYSSLEREGRRQGRGS